MSAARHAADTLVEAERLMRAVEDLHTLVLAGQPVMPSTTQALVSLARATHYHATRYQVADALFPERRLDAAHHLTLPREELPAETLRFLREHAIAKESQ